MRLRDRTNLNIGITATIPPSGHIFWKAKGLKSAREDLTQIVVLVGKCVVDLVGVRELETEFESRFVPGDGQTPRSGRFRWHPVPIRYEISCGGVMMGFSQM
jgi:hypothetical protein